MNTLDHELDLAAAGLRRVAERIPNRSWRTTAASPRRASGMLSFVGGALIVIAVLGLPALLIDGSAPLDESAGENGSLAVPTEPDVPGRAIGCDRPETTTTISPATIGAGEPSVSEDTEQGCDGIGTTTTTMLATTTTMEPDADPSQDDADDGTSTSLTEACFAPMTLRLEHEWPVVEVWDRRVDDGFLSITYALNSEDDTSSSVVLVLGGEGAEIPLLMDLEAAGQVSFPAVSVHGTHGQLNQYAEGPWSLHWTRSDGIHVALVLLQVPPTAAADPGAFVLQLAGAVELMDEEELTELVTYFESYQTNPWPLPCAGAGA